MRIKLTEDPLVCPACDPRISGPGLGDCQCSSCEMQRCLESEETRRTNEQIRLLLSRDAVLREIRPMEIGGSRW